MNPQQFIARMEQYWAAYKALALRHARERIELGRAYHQANSDSAPETSPEPLDEVAAELAQDAIYDRATSLITDLFRFATSTFSPNASTPVDIEEMEIGYEAGHPCHPTTFSPERLWAELEERYGNGIGHVLAYRKRAKTIARAFRISGDEPMTMKHGRLVLTQSAYVEKYSSCVRLGSHHSETLRRDLIPALISFATWAGKPVLAEALAPIATRFSYPADVVSRESFLMGNTEEGRIKLVTFHTSFEWTFEPAVAEPLSLFLSEFFFSLAEMSA
ncbi:hypothetical protein [Paraburkholderia humisilvae]|uniref:Uncharacterized protein n=1 Tax=Paraburkholderia humisilvae TaxID=627669 RepID=A0A6J5DNU3_9BURK|nr:hypothetical protein [Paraburkholderia humisilvae]CAB3754665.1 hypothetical protein LMG29542_02416 [Paraburkholderia humisilvae]